MSDLINEPGNKKKGLGRGLGSLLGGSEGMASASNNGSGVSAFGSLSGPTSNANTFESSQPKVTNTQALNTQNNQTKAQAALAEQLAVKQASASTVASNSEVKSMTSGQTLSQPGAAQAPVAKPMGSAAVTTTTNTSINNAAALSTQARPMSAAAAAPVSQSTTAATATQIATSQVVPAAMIEGKVWQVAIDKLTSGEYQPRQHFEKEALNELAQSIRANGILQPIVARKLPSGRMEIIAGERRWRAAQLAGLHEVPVLLKSFDDRQALEMAIVENVQREDLNPIEEAEGYSRLITEFNLSQQAVADKVGKERATVANAVRLLQLPILVREMVAKSELSSGHAKVLLGLSDPNKMLELARRVLAEKLPVRKLEKIIAEANEAKDAKPLDSKQEMANRLVEGIADDLQKLLGTKVSLDYRQGKGKVSIQFYSDDELTDLVEKLKAACQK